MRARSLTRHGVFAFALIGVACERARNTSTTPGSAPPTTAESVATTKTPKTVTLWDSSAGPVLLVRVSSASMAQVVFPEYADSTVPDTLRLDASSLAGHAVVLVTRSGRADTARVVNAGEKTWAGDECVEWPAASVAVASDTAVATGWTVAFLPRGFRPVPVDSIEGLTAPDSARLAADLTRLASALPDDTSRAYHGLPFAVRYAYRFAAAPGIRGVIADLVRRLNQEASPLEQHTLLLAEQDSARADSPLHVVYHERSGGDEDSLETTDVLAAVRLPAPPHVALVLVRVGPETSAYALLERAAGGTWRVRWTSVHTGC